MRALLTAVSLIFLATSALSQSSELTRLDTRDDSRGWEAVGRLDIDGRGFCTGALISPGLVLTAAHCLYDRDTGARIDPTRIEFLAGWRNGRASAYRNVRRAVTHDDYVFDAKVDAARVRNDVALLELSRPIRTTEVVPFDTDVHPRKGDRIGVVSYAHDRADAPSLQEICDVMARQRGVLVMSCDVDFGASGSPVFSFERDRPRIVSVISAKAEASGQKVALGTALAQPLGALRKALAEGAGYEGTVPPSITRVIVGKSRRKTGAKFIRPDGP